eukprot:6210631-Pleurochrysis_carterae.AAC.1
MRSDEVSPIFGFCTYLTTFSGAITTLQICANYTLSPSSLVRMCPTAPFACACAFLHAMSRACKQASLCVYAHQVVRVVHMWLRAEAGLRTPEYRVVRVPVLVLLHAVACNQEILHSQHPSQKPDKAFFMIAHTSCC